MKNFIFPFLLTFSSLFSFAQTSKFEIGASAGPQISGIYQSTKGMNVKPSINFNAGLNLHYHFAKHWLLKTELDFIQTGFRVDGDYNRIPNTDYVYTKPIKKRVSKSSFLEIPILVAFRTNGSKVSFFMNTGPCWLLQLSERYIITYTDGSKDRSTSAVNRRNYFQWVYGIGMQFKISSRLKIPFEVRYQNDLLYDFFKDFADGSVGINTGILYQL